MKTISMPLEEYNSEQLDLIEKTKQKTKSECYNQFYAFLQGYGRMDNYFKSVGGEGYHGEDWEKMLAARRNK